MAITQDVVQYDNDFLVEVRIEDTEDLSGSRVVLPAEEAFEFGCVLARAAQHAWRLEQEWRASLSLTLRAELRPEEPGFFGRALRHPKLRCDFERDDDLRMIFEALEALDRRVFFSDPRGKNPGAGALLTDLDPTKPA